jgi:hypothetical protein
MYKSPRMTRIAFCSTKRRIIEKGVIFGGVDLGELEAIVSRTEFSSTLAYRKIYDNRLI